MGYRRRPLLLLLLLLLLLTVITFTRLRVPGRIHAQAKRYLERQQYGGVQPISVTKKLYWPSSKTLYTIVQVMSYCHQAAHFFSISLGGNLGLIRTDPPDWWCGGGTGIRLLVYYTSSGSGSILERSDGGER
ncbi:uncharacterized protein BO88DRAFT_42039 [Aspergillus vadensis CBS 113365]|uniref:Uncharacterized protein n=1 Tax=Aspergillus vadensis (strain CBS 113365 / IMI 142717 / IBT 24658) TaxID=1448311 RepID=A0A319B8R2_ASPVC|nr:hypothetical protein BO88DRAFT_42039 [Aspergillus vadensis CBS 113365]PYH69097.1 hypothetical protein BO88DRAFT_42039 [Aspergillus vadensis CBS 113365]